MLPLDAYFFNKNEWEKGNKSYKETSFKLHENAFLSYVF